jgi:uncharacterized protein (DUF433 family)
MVIDPRIAFGRPVVASRSITTSTIAERIDAGESLSDIAADYDLAQSEIEQAVVYERAASTARRSTSAPSMGERV